MIDLPRLYLVRHGQTAWSLSGRHTGRTDVPLTPVGEENARRVGRRLAGLAFARVWCSPSQRARRTCELAGFAAKAEIDPDLAEWDYGKFEGLHTAEIHALQPGWELFRDGCPGGESVADVSARSSRVVSRVRSIGGDVLLFSSGHFLRSLAGRWLGLDVAAGRLLMLEPGSLSILGYEHSIDEPAVALWNQPASPVIADSSL